MNAQPANPTPQDRAANDPTTARPAAGEPTRAQPAASDPTAMQPTATDPTAAQPAAPDATAVQPAAGQVGAPNNVPSGSSFGGQPGTPYGGQPGASYDAPPGSSFGGQPGAPYGVPAGSPYGGQPGAPYGGQPGMPYGPPPDGPYGAHYPGFAAPGPSTYPPPGSGGTSGFAVASLIFGILGGVLLSVIFGIVALVQIRKRGQTGRGLAIAGLVLSGCWLLAIVIGATVGILSDSKGSSPGDTGSGTGTVSVTTLKRGDCINGISGTGAIEDLPVVSCSEPHEGEVYAVFELPAGPWPGDNAVQRQAETRCEALMRSYAPSAADTVEVLYLHPLQRSWSRDRGVTCVATDERGATTGSIRD